MVVGEVAIEADAVVIGGGPGGYAAAIRLGQLGKSVVLIERDALGGVCLNRGCIPSKALVHAADQYARMSGGDKLGIRFAGGSPVFDLNVWQQWKTSVVSRLGKGIDSLCKANGVAVVKGDGCFLSGDRIGVRTDEGTDIYKFAHAVVATGSRPYIPASIAVDHRFVVDSASALQATELPARLSVVGGGYIGMEIGMAFAKLGASVTVIEQSDRILPGIDGRLAGEVARNAVRLGMEIRTATLVEQSVQVGGGVQLHVRSERGGKEVIESDKTLVAAGRVPNTDGLGLEQAGIRVDARGYVLVDERCRTAAPHIYAIGDITPGAALAHRASRQGMVAAEAICGLPSAFDSPYVPYAIFTDPQIAGVGLTREAAEREGYPVKSAQFPFGASGRALATDEPGGFAEVIVDARTDLLLGLHVVGADASNLIGEGVLALEMGARAQDIALTMHPHPTLSEGWMEAAAAALGQAIHTADKRPAGG